MRPAAVRSATISGWQLRLISISYGGGLLMMFALGVDLGMVSRSRMVNHRLDHQRITAQLAIGKATYIPASGMQHPQKRNDSAIIFNLTNFPRRGMAAQRYAGTHDVLATRQRHLLACASSQSATVI